MSVSVKGLTKIYGVQKAVNNLSFEATPGEIVGFLGPNGAGKSTTMKMLTCYADPTEGSASICGYDILKNPTEVRNNVGYLPEHNPLYKDLYVKEFLRFIAGIHKISKPQHRISELIEMTGLGLEQSKLIGSLSKGYRQRVGLASALMHDPQVLILDEPTSGLDPNQLSDIRSLIARLGKEKTVIFSTHIMQEVAALCDRVLIINHGNLIADDPIDALQERIVPQHELEVSFESSISADDLAKISNVLRVENIAEAGQHKYRIISSKDVRKEVFLWAVKEDQILIGISKMQMSVENVFKELTKEDSDV